MGLQHQHAQHAGVGGFQDVAQKQEVAQRLRHLLVVDLQHAAVDPVVGEGAAACRLGLGALVFVMRESQVGAAAVDVERQAQVFLRHGRALDVPTGAALAPGAFPRRLAGLRGLPKGEIKRVALAVFQALAVGAQLAVAAFHLVHVAVGKLAVLVVGAHGEVHVALHGVRMAFFDELFHQSDHLVDLLGGARTHIRIHHAGGMHVVDERLRVLGGNLGGAAAFLVGLLDDLVVHVGDVLHELHLVPAPDKVAADGVERYEGTGVADMDVVVHRRAAHVHVHLAVAYGDEGALFACHGVIDLDHRFSLENGKRAQAGARRSTAGRGSGHQHRLTRATAWAEMPSSRPSKPKCSVVVAFTPRFSTGIPQAFARFARIWSR